MAETEETAKYWQNEMERLRELRDSRDKVQASLDYVTKLFQAIEQDIVGIDLHPAEIEKLPKEQQEIILKKQQKVIRALCDKIIIYSNHHIKIEGLLDGSESVSFNLAGLRSRC